MDMSSLWQYILVSLFSIESLVISRPSSRFTTAINNLEPIIWINGSMNVSMRRKVKLFSSKTKNYLQVKNKKVNAKGDKNSAHAELTLESVGYSLVRIKGFKSNRYICYSNNAKLIAKEHGDDENCVFKEEFNKKTYGRRYFISFKHNWPIAFKNNGKARPGLNLKKHRSTGNATYEFLEQHWS